MEAGVIDEASYIKQVLETSIQKVWDGKQCILELKEADYNWKQAVYY